jgi:hypothetical protein
VRVYNLFNFEQHTVAVLLRIPLHFPIHESSSRVAAESLYIVILFACSRDCSVVTSSQSCSSLEEPCLLLWCAELLPVLLRACASVSLAFSTALLSVKAGPARTLSSVVASLLNDTVSFFCFTSFFILLWSPHRSVSCEQPKQQQQKRIYISTKHNCSAIYCG